MTQDEKQAMKRRHGGHAFIPAGIFIGLGVGMLVGHVVSGALIGIGLGFLVSSLVSGREEPDPSAGAPPCCGFMGRDLMPIVFGVFLILVGIGLVWAPLLVWPYLFASFLILLGIVFLLRGLRK
jgi:hypothetical protein